MARKAKGSGFKMRSGNTTPFKQMGSSPVKAGEAETTLVTAARHAAMQNVPKDLSAQYNKTAEGVIAAQKGKMKMLKEVAQEAPGIITGVAKRIDKAAETETEPSAEEIKKSWADMGEGYSYDRG